MFKEIENEILSIISDDAIEKIAHMPSKEIAKTMELIYNVKFEDIERVYNSSLENINKMTVIYKNEKHNSLISDMCFMNGKTYYITFFPSHLLNKDENNAITLSRSIIKYISNWLDLIMYTYDGISKKVKDNIYDLIIFQAIPILTCSIMRRIYNGPSLAKVIYMSLSEMIPAYKKSYTERGINSILNILDEDLSVEQLLDNSLICAIKPDDENYPGIWPSKSKEEKS